MLSTDLVSILVPAYNHERYVEACLQAIVAQTYRPLELLIADDASDDSTSEQIADFIAEHGDQFERVHFDRHEHNRGIAETLNALLARARGKYVFVNASDDRAEPEAIGVLVTELSRHPRAAMAVGDNAILDANGDRVYWDSNRGVIRDPVHATFLTWVDDLRTRAPRRTFTARKFGRLRGLYLVNHVPNGKLMRRAAIVTVGGWRRGTLEDWDLNLRLARRYRLRYVDRVLFGYRWHDTNTVKDAAYMEPAFNRTVDLFRADYRRNPWLAVRALGARRMLAIVWGRVADCARTLGPPRS